MDIEGAIRANSLTKAYRSGGGTVIVFDNLSLNVPRGERLAIVGESGAGKSTLLQLLGGLDKADSGSVCYSPVGAAASEINLTQLNEQDLADFRNRHLGFVWQNPSLLPEFTALENVMMPLLIRGVATGAAADAAHQRPGRSGARCPRRASGRRIIRR